MTTSGGDEPFGDFPNTKGPAESAGPFVFEPYGRVLPDDQRIMEARPYPTRQAVTTPMRPGTMKLWLK